MELAKLFDGEVICADSRTIYTQADIGTAKPSPADQKAVRHHMLDLIEPSEYYSAARFKTTALQVIENVQNTNKLPILVGGSGLYIDSVLFDYEFLPPASPAVRSRLQQLSVEQLQAELKAKGLALPSNQRNPVHLIRAIETNGAVPHKSAMRPDAHVFGLLIDKPNLEQRVQNRTDQMLAAGLLAETIKLAKSYGWDAPGLQAPAYKALHEHIDGPASLPQARQSFIENDLALAKRQKTWFKRNLLIQWHVNGGEIVDSVTTLLNKSL